MGCQMIALRHHLDDVDTIWLTSVLARDFSGAVVDEVQFSNVTFPD